MITSTNIARCASLLILGLLTGCANEPDIEIHAGIDVCDECHMIIDQVNQASGYVLDRDFITFDSPGCLLRSYESLSKATRPHPADIYFADYRDGTLHNADNVAFLLTSHIPTVMNARVIVFADRDAAGQAMEYADELVTDWMGYRTVRGTPDITVEILVGPDGMEPDMVEVAKDDLVLFRVTGQGLSGALTLSFSGYPEVTAITIPADGDLVETRVLASRPGTGFPIVGDDGQPMGMMRVTGAHTADEAVN